MAKTITQIQQMITSGLHSDREVINEFADYLEANPGGSEDSGEPYLVYIALISQSGTDAPTVDAVLRNTFQTEFTYSYQSAGRYRISNTAITENNCFPIISAKGDTTHEAKIYATLGAVDIRSTFNGTKGNNDLNKTPIEIRVYP